MRLFQLPFSNQQGSNCGGQHDQGKDPDGHSQPAKGYYVAFLHKAHDHEIGQQVNDTVRAVVMSL